MTTDMRAALQKIYDELPLRDQDGNFEPHAAFARRLKQIAWEALSTPQPDEARLREIQRGDIVISKETRKGEITEGHEYVVCEVVNAEYARYLTVLGDDRRGYSLLEKLFERSRIAAPAPSTVTEEMVDIAEAAYWSAPPAEGGFRSDTAAAGMRAALEAFVLAQSQQHKAKDKL